MLPRGAKYSLWRSLLSEYSDRAVCDFSEFGRPLGFDYSRCGVFSSRVSHESFES